MDLFLHFRPDGRGNVGPGGGGALFSVIGERGAEHAGDQSAGVGGGIGKHEVLAAGLSHQAGIGIVALDIAAHFFPHQIEHFCGTCEVESCHAGICDHIFRKVRSPAGYEIDDAGRQSCLLEDLHEVIVGEAGCGGRFPDHYIARDRRRAAQVSADGCEVKRRQGRHEPLQRTVLDAVDGSGSDARLLLVDLLQEIGIEPQEIAELRDVDLRFPEVFALSQHGGRQHFVAIGTSQQIRSL